MPKHPDSEETAPSRSPVDVELDRIKEEIHGFIWQYVPESEREEFELQIHLYLETHPVMARRIEAMRALASQKASAVVGEGDGAEDGSERKLG